ncbi:MAG: hypothetical protein WHS88_12175 [Anaerohalosphaeraceae bacterium]
MELNELLEGLLNQIHGGMEPFLSYDDVSELPPEQFEEMQRIKILVETRPARYFTCRECPDEDCGMISLTIDRDRKTGKQMGFFLCQKERGAGLKKVALERLRRWEILPDKIEAYLRSIAPKKENLPPKSKITKKEANIAIRTLIPELKREMGLKTDKDFEKITARILADRIGCSLGLVSSCSAWKAFVKTRCQKQTTSSKTTRLNKALLDNLSADDKTPDEIAAAKELEQLVAEQKADMDHQDNKKNRVFPDR